MAVSAALRCAGYPHRSSTPVLVNDDWHPPCIEAGWGLRRVEKPMQSIRRLVAVSAALLLAPFVTAVSLAGPAHAASSPGASVPFTEYLAATQGATNGTVLPV